MRTHVSAIIMTISVGCGQHDNTYTMLRMYLCMSLMNVDGDHLYFDTNVVVLLRVCVFVCFMLSIAVPPI